MGLRVCKFGGSSVADVIQVEKTAAIIRSHADRRYVVVSAPGKRYSNDSKITDLLYLCQTHVDQNVDFGQIFQVISDRYMVLAMNLGVSDKVDIHAEFEEIKSHLVPGAKPDYIASRGEYLNAKIIAAYLGYDFVDAAGLIKFDQKGRLLLEETDAALSEELKKHKKALVPGFYGTTPDGEIKTFARGGSDITGSLVARAVKAEVYENWTDVSGFLMTDPRIVPEAKPIHSISYRELRELSYMGASVLHEDAIYPAKLADIPINIRNTNDPEDPGTMITAERAKDDERVVTGIAGSKDYTVISLYKNMLAGERGFLRKILNVMEEYDVSVDHVPTGVDTLCVVASNKQLAGKLDEIVEEIKNRAKPDAIEVSEDLALIATVGEGMNRRAGTSAKLFGALGEAGVSVRLIDQGSSEMNIIVGVENKDFNDAIRAIYKAFEE